MKAPVKSLQMLLASLFLPVICNLAFGLGQNDAIRVPATPLAYDLFGSRLSAGDQHALVVSSPTSFVLYRVTKEGLAQEQTMETFGWIRSVCLDGNRALIGIRCTKETEEFVGAAIVFEYDGTAWVKKATLISAEKGDGFGGSVSLSGDVAMVGAPRTRGRWMRFGCVYVFRYDGSEWKETQKLTVANIIGWFGCSISIFEDRALIGAPEFDDWFPGRGSAYVFRYDGRWVEEQKLSARDGRRADRFGQSVSLGKDVALVGAPYHTIGANKRQGCAYVFRKNKTKWVEEQQITGADVTNLGWSVSLVGGRALVGAPCLGQLTAPGAAYVFGRRAAKWHKQDVLNPQDVTTGPSRFGKAVALGETFALVGAPQEGRKGAINAGAAYSFKLQDH